MGYTKETIKGVSWVGAFRAATRAISLVRIIVLARILTPSQFGFVGIATLALGFVEMLTETGINVFLIQEKHINKYIDTAWIVSILRGFIIALIIVGSASFVAGFFNAADAYSLLLLVSVVPIVRGFINPAVVTFQKDLAFDREFWFRLSIFSVDSLTAIFLAMLTKEASSLVWGFIVGAFFEVALSFLVVRVRPQFSFQRKRMEEVFNRGKWVTGFSFLHYAFQNGDNIVVGRILGSFSLGLYQVGYRIASLPSEVVDAVSRVTFPVYAKIADDKTRLKKAFLRTGGGVLLLALPFGLTLFLFAESVVRVFLGDNWIELVPALKILAIFGTLRAIINTVFPLFLSVKKQEYVAIVTFASFVGLAIAVVPLTSIFGIVGAGGAALIGTLIAIPFVCFYLLRILR